MNIITYGENRVLIYGIDILEKSSIAAHFKKEFPEVVLRFGLESLMLDFNATNIRFDLNSLTESVNSYRKTGQASDCLFKTHKVPVVYNGEDIIKVSEILNMEVEDFITYHSSIEWIVGMIGFAPGFPYLVPVDNKDREFLNNVSRLSTPRSKVPAGSVALAAGMSSIYPQEMPGGWNLIGVTDFNLFDFNSEKPSILEMNDRVFFNVIGGEKC